MAGAGPSLVLHIGLPRTGSTSLQYFLSKNDRLLARYGVVYARAGRTHSPNAHHALAHALQEAGLGTGVPEAWSQVLAEARAGGVRLAAVSSEVFGTRWRTPQIQRLRQFAEDVDLRAFVYIRDFAALVSSAYAETCKRADTIDDFDRFFAAYEERGRFALFDRLRPWGEVLGWDRLRIRSLDGVSLAAGDLYRDGLDALGIPTDAASDARPETMLSRNVTPGWKTIEIVRAINVAERAGETRAAMRADPARKAHFDAIWRAAEAAGNAVGFDRDRGRYLSRDQAERCRILYGAEIARLNAVLAGPALPVHDMAAAGRAFLPAFDRVPVSDVEAFASAFAALGSREGVTSAAIARILGMLAPKAVPRRRSWMRRLGLPVAGR
jgi:hypothetical protein